ncbi:hypothetical protein TNCV_3775071 [Trichonephila clavipes]|nr:hypothetical protein TNCV_3775071 [Trichonephila clavipes]
MPFGLPGADPNFQEAIDIIHKPMIGKFVSVYMDDVIISSPSFIQHVKHLKEVFRLLHEAGLMLNKDKSAFGKLSSPTNLHQISTGDPASLFHSKVSLLLDSHFASGSSPIPFVFNDCSPPSCLSPSEVEVVFRKLLGGKVPAFADDLAVASFGLSRKELEDNTNKILSLVNSKLSELNLSIATAKTVSVFSNVPFFNAVVVEGARPSGGIPFLKLVPIPSISLSHTNTWVSTLTIAYLGLPI